MTVPLAAYPFPVALDSSGDPISGAKLYIVTAGGTWPDDAVTVYSDYTGLVTTTNPLVSNSGGHFPAYWLTPGRYDFNLYLPNTSPPGDSAYRTAPGVSVLDDTEVTSVAMTKAALAALPAASRDESLAYVTLGYSAPGDGGGGMWRWDPSDLETECTTDTRGGVFVPPTGEDGSDGAFVRIIENATYNVLWFGAAGDGSTDDTAAIEGMRAVGELNLGIQAATVSGPSYRFPSGQYGFASSITIDVTGETWVSDGGWLKALNNSVSIAVDALNAVVDGFTIWQPLRPTTAIGTLHHKGGSGCAFRRIEIIGGWHGIKGDDSGSASGTGDTYYEDVRVRDCYADYAYFTNYSGVWWNRGRLDNNGVATYPAGTPVAANWRGAWAPTTAYVLKDLVTNNGWLFQCVTAGTSAGSGGPDVADFGTEIADGAAEWETLRRADAAAVFVDSGCTAHNYDNVDMTIGHVYSCRIDDIADPGNPPQQINFAGFCEFGQPIHRGLYIVEGKGISITSCVVDFPIRSDATGIDVGDTEHVQILNNRVLGNPTSVAIGANARDTVVGGGNVIAGTTYAVRVAAGATDFQIQDNNLAGSATWGAVTNAIVVDAGASDHYDISGNTTFGATTRLSDGGTGTDKNVEDGGVVHSVRTFRFTDDGASTGVTKFERISTSQAVNDELWELQFFGNSVQYTGLRNYIIDPSGGGEDGSMVVKTRVNGTLGGRAFFAAGLSVGLATDPGAGAISALNQFIVDANGATAADAAADDIVIRRQNGNAGMTILSGTSNAASIYFGDSGGAIRGAFLYDNSADDLSIYAGGNPRFIWDESDTEWNSAGHVRPATTEAFDLGSASFEWNNIFTQNAVTVSDQRRKNDLGEIDGEWALEFLRELQPRWFSFKHTTIPARPARTRRQLVPVMEERQVRRVEIVDGEPVLRVVSEKRPKVERKLLRDARGEPVTQAVAGRDGRPTGEREPVYVDVPVEIEEDVEVEAAVPERVIPHGRPHTGFFAQEVKDAMTAAGLEDWAGYAYEKGDDAHVLRLQEMIAVLVAAVVRQDERIKALGG